ncbi:tetratricopeptide repeat protein [Pseudemcibacter aquimaris]|uniref:tetratricopeptide repeat protein n=1 Tax=Pseudemcibacter aquimaris TaxID=2857064 RepID=UPI002013571B|nr:tetratricopeptide repeat protein [Pseudemcibacter aquimaris]MCC3861055.1 tetratricopeptide repeat protein [Pseudemcibacter aquimaris]WDU59873.1 tetratricopeptide repeat protein [Pseudemcibacter aquimaris]
MSNKKEFTAEQALEIAKNAADKGDKVKATKYFKAVLQKYPENQDAIDGIRALNPNALFQSDLDELKEMLKEGKFREVEVRCSMEIEKYPNVFELFHLLGIALGNQKKHKEALPAFKRAAELNSHDAHAQFNLGNAFNVVGDYKNALSSYMRAIKIEPKYAPAMNNAGNLLMRLKDYEAAAEIFYQASRILPGSFEVLVSLAGALKALGNYKEAIAFYNQAIQIDGRVAEVFIDMAICYKEDGNVDEALNILETITRDNPENVEAHNCLGNVLKEIGNLDAAMHHYMQALSIAPKAAFVHFNVAILHRDSGNLEVAIQAMDQALEIANDYPEYLMVKAELLKMRGKYSEALSIYIQLDSKMPRRPVITANLAMLYFLCGDDVASRRYADILNDEFIEKIEDKQKRDICLSHKNLLNGLHEVNEVVERNTDQDAEKVLFIGDKDAFAAKGHIFNIDGKNLVGETAWIDNVKLSDFLTDSMNLATGSIKDNMENLPIESNVVFAFGAEDFTGEISLWNDSDDQVQKVSEIAEAYLNRTHQLVKNAGLKPSYCSVAAPREENKKNLSFIEQFNAALKAECEKEDVRFIDVFAVTNAKNGVADGTKHLDNCHVSATAYTEALA